MARCKENRISRREKSKAKEAHVRGKEHKKTIPKKLYRGLIPIAGLGIGLIYVNFQGGLCFHMALKNIRCARHTLDKLEHADSCIRKRQNYRRCFSGLSGNHPHEKNSREQAEAMALRWGLRVTKYQHYNWTNQEVWDHFREIWPFKLKRNPKFIIKRMRCMLKSAGLFGSLRGTEEEHKQMESLCGDCGLDLLIDFIEALRQDDGRFFYMDEPEYEILTQPSWDELPSTSYCCMDRRPKPNARSIFERSEPDSGNETLASRTRENSKKGSRRREVESDDEDNVEDDESGTGTENEDVEIQEPSPKRVRREASMFRMEPNTVVKSTPVRRKRRVAQLLKDKTSKALASKKFHKRLSSSWHTTSLIN